MADFLSEKTGEIERRLEELRPLHQEYLRLERAHDALAGLETNGARRRPAPAREARPTRAEAGPGRPRGRRSGGRAEAALAYLRQNPGATVNQVADGIGLEQRNYLYRVMAGLQAEGAVRKEGRGFVAT